MSERELHLYHTYTMKWQQHDKNDVYLTKDFFLVVNFVEKFVHFYLLEDLTSFPEIAIWLHNAGTEFQDLLGTNPDLGFR